MENIDEKTLKEEIKLPLVSGISSKVNFNVAFMDTYYLAGLPSYLIIGSIRV